MNKICREIDEVKKGKRFVSHEGEACTVTDVVEEDSKTFVLYEMNEKTFKEELEFFESYLCSEDGTTLKRFREIIS